MSALRVCHVVESLEARDVSRVAAVVATGLPNGDFVAEMIAFRDGSLGDVLRRAGLRVRIVGERRGIALAAAWEAARLIDAARPDIVHLWDDWSVRWVGPLLAWRGRSRFVCSRRDLPRAFEPGARRIDRFVLQRAAAVMANDAFVAERGRSSRGLEATRPWTIVADGLLPSLGQADDRTTVLAELGVPHNAPIFATYVPRGRAQDAKDVVWVAALLRNLYEDLRLIIVTEDGELAPLRRFCAAMDHDDRTVFATDPALFGRIVPHLAVCVDASYWTGPTQAILAAQAVGVPVVAVDTPIRRRLIDVERTGYVAPRHDREQMTRHAYRLLNDESLRTTMGTAAREFVAARFLMQTMLDGYAGVYRRVIA